MYTSPFILIYYKVVFYSVSDRMILGFTTIYTINAYHH